jgi:HTH-type transcriptional regulator/antitoxin HipB
MEIYDTYALGKLIRQHRKAMGLTQKNAAGLCGVGERFLSEIERGKATASLGKTLQVLKRLGLKVQIQGLDE